MKFLDEFKEFISRGNVMDMAVGVVVGASFKSIVDSLVKDIINPGIAYVVSLISKALSTAASTVGDSGTVQNAMDMSKWIIPGTSINIGNFISAIINFLILAFVIFIAVKGLNILNDKIKKKTVKEEPTPAEPTQVELLVEIRDLLKSNQKNTSKKERL